MDILILILLYIIVLSSFFFLINFKWIVNTIREISKNHCGYTKFIQTILMIFLVGIFSFVVIYYFLNPDKVDRLDIILTVVVGWLGLIIGRFFGESAMAGLNEEQQAALKRSLELKKKETKIRDKIVKMTDSLIKNLKEK